MLDHVSLKVANHAAAQAFYDKALAPLGLTRLVSMEGSSGYGASRPFFWIGQGDKAGYCHVAFSAPDHATVDAFHAAALAAGGRDNGSPGLREYYHPTYYGAFVLDPDGHNIETVCHGAGPARPA
ncbi:VOC family protein [Phenylobacterium sp.]|uniref:VOC family protein n=1 Tax=Phenylobacterium sp. TaxID=1871053 RepID=UPI002733133D|nr:VOC family protein [Phenylobacterium sp.]MDP3631999.1 VOC family protein [Phenylobacterium sp.]